MPKPAKSARREEARATREKIRAKSDADRAKVRDKVRGAASAVCLLVTLLAVSACNTATPASKSASAKACDNVTTINNYIGLLPVQGTNAAQPVAALALGEGGLTISVHDVNGTISQSADTAGGDSTDMTANPSMAAGVIGDKPIEAIQKAVAAFATPQDALGATFSALAKKYGWGSATNALVSAAASCADGSCSTGACADGACSDTPEK